MSTEMASGGRRLDSRGVPIPRDRRSCPAITTARHLPVACAPSFFSIPIRVAPIFFSRDHGDHALNVTTFLRRFPSFAKKNVELSTTFRTPVRPFGLPLGKLLPYCSSAFLNLPDLDVHRFVFSCPFTATFFFARASFAALSLCRALALAHPASVVLGRSNAIAFLPISPASFFLGYIFPRETFPPLYPITLSGSATYHITRGIFFAARGNHLIFGRMASPLQSLAACS